MVASLVDLIPPFYSGPISIPPGSRNRSATSFLYAGLSVRSSVVSRKVSMSRINFHLVVECKDGS